MRIIKVSASTLRFYVMGPLKMDHFCGCGMVLKLMVHIYQIVHGLIKFFLNFLHILVVLARLGRGVA
jgi:hypothetical protein